MHLNDKVDPPKPCLFLIRLHVTQTQEEEEEKEEEENTRLETETKRIHRVFQKETPQTVTHCSWRATNSPTGRVTSLRINFTVMSLCSEL